jgi:hypothetical protein
MIVKENLPSDVTGNSTGDVNRLLAWIPEVRDGEETLVKAEFLIYTAPTLADDGSVLNYGEWDMNVNLDANPGGDDSTGTPASYFAASARIGGDGSSTLKVHDKFTESFDGMNEMSSETRGILVRTGDGAGYGKVEYPDWDSCWQMDPSGETANPCEMGIPTQVAQYAYTSRDLAVQEIDENGNADAPVYKDRILDGAIRVIHRYKLFYANADANNGIEAGDDVEKHVSFGFPLSYEVTDQQSGNTWNEFGWYGAWQGRHQFWGGGNYTAVGGNGTATVFTRQDVPPDQTAPTYTLAEFNGTLTKRNVVEADLADIQDIVVETWINTHYDMMYDATAGAWMYCKDGYIDFWQVDQNGNPLPPVCYGFDGMEQSFTEFTDYGSLMQDESGRKWVNIGRWDEQAGQQYEYLYLASDPQITGLTFSGAGFYPATWGNMGLEPLTDANGGGLYTPADADSIYVDIGGSIYISYNGDFSGSNTGWVQKTVTGFDEQTWTAEFDANGDSPFNPPRGTEYYLNANGSNYIVKRKEETLPNGAASDYEVMLELQTAANPVNVGNIMPTSTVTGGTVYLKAPWEPNVRFDFIADDTSSNYMKMVYLTDDPNTSDIDESQIETVVSESKWGLQVWDDMGTASDFTDDMPLSRLSDGSLVTVQVDEWGFPDVNAGETNRPTEFNWEYSEEPGGWGSQQYLIDGNGDYVILSDPISFSNVQVYDNLGNLVTTDGSTPKTVNLQFDGWMHGLPDMYHELAKNDWSILGLGEKVRRLLAGQEITDVNGTVYYAKPMDMSLFLGEISAQSITDGGRTIPDLTQADAVDLSAVPGYTAHGMGALPTENNGSPLEVKYSEGKPIQ